MGLTHSQRADRLATLATGWGEDLGRPSLKQPFWDGVREKYDPEETPGATTPAHILYVILTADEYIERPFLERMANELCRYLPQAEQAGAATVLADLERMSRWLGIRIVQRGGLDPNAGS